jgi:hypothetical protein
MGRGRAKAKQTKVARDLKYRTYETDFSSLERELRSSQPDGTPASAGFVRRHDDDEVGDATVDDLSRRYG